MSLITADNEQYVLACILNHPETLWDVGAVLNSRDFSIDAHKYLYLAIKKVIEEGKDIDPASVYSTLNDTIIHVIGEVSKTNDAKDYINDLQQLPHSLKNLEDNINTIKLASTGRQMVATFDDLKGAIISGNGFGSVAEMVSHCEDKIVGLGVINETLDNDHQVALNIREVLTERAKHPVEVPGIRTGFSRLDKSLGGLKPGQLTVVAARPKVGKTTLLLGWAKYMAVDHNIPVLMLDTEMETMEITTRLVAMISGVEEKKLLNGLFSISEEETQKVYDAVSVVEQAPIYHIYMPEWNFDTIQAYARKFKVRHNIGVMFFDYIKLPDSTDLKSAQEYVHLGNLTTDLKNKIAGKLEIPVVTAAQMNRIAVGADSVDTNMIAGSDRILHYANHLLALTRKTPEEVEECGMKANLNLYIMASRSSETGARMDILFKKSKLQMYEIGSVEEPEGQWDEL
jgi:replicative DNA helicase